MERNDELVGNGTEDRPCCSSQFNTWHARPCTVNGPRHEGEVTNTLARAMENVGMEIYPKRECRVPGCDHDPDNLSCANPGRWGEQGTVGCVGAHHTSDGICVGHSPGELVGCAMENIGIDFGHDARAMALIPHRWCCGGLPTDRHLDGCPTKFFAEGQTVIKPDFEWVLGPGRIWPQSTRMRIAEDRFSSDRTFENETRPL